MRVISLFNMFQMVISQFTTGISNIVSEGNMCGGMMPAEMVSSCDNNLECVYTLGPMLADAPGFCRPTCPTIRDQWGNCLPDNCEIWDDGCNSCTYDKSTNSLVDCTENVCYTIKEHQIVKDIQLMKIHFFIVLNLLMFYHK